MMKTVVVVSMLVVCCYCAEKSEMLDESRAKKKKSPARLWVMLLILVLSKVAVFKVVSFLMFLGFFQKLFYFGGIFLKYFLNKSKAQTQPAPGPVYGAPQDYNTVGYSYGPPEHEAFANHENLPSITELGGPLNWLLNKP